MAPSSSESKTEQSFAQVQWDDVVRFVRQLSHDLRNHLNAVELQSAFIAELAADPELKDEVKRLRTMISQIGAALQNVTSRLNPAGPNRITYGVNEFVEDLRAKLKTDFPEESATIQWDVTTDDAKLEVDPQQLQQAVLEIFRNAFEHKSAEGNLQVRARTKDGSFSLSLHEPKPAFDLPTKNWGAEPLRRVNRGHYGLGLYRARRIVEAHAGQLHAEYDPGAVELTTTVTFPLSQPAT